MFSSLQHVRCKQGQGVQDLFAVDLDQIRRSIQSLSLNSTNWNANVIRTPIWKSDLPLKFTKPLAALGRVSGEKYDCSRNSLLLYLPQIGN